MTVSEFDALKIGDKVKRLSDGCIYCVTAVNIIDHLWWEQFREVVVANPPCPLRLYIYSKLVFYNLDNFELIEV